MKIIGFNLSKIQIERKEKIEGKIEVNQNIDLKEVTKEDIPISDKEALKIKFNFTINYSNDSAKLEFEGFLIILPEKEESKEILKNWKTKEFSNEIRVPIFNFIMNKCNVKALNLEDELGLPYHIPMPRLNPNQQQNN